VVLKKRRQVARHGRVLLERQADVLEARRPPPHRPVADRAAREKSVDQDLERLLALHFNRHRAADQFAASPQD